MSHFVTVYYRGCLKYTITGIKYVLLVYFLLTIDHCGDVFHIQFVTL